MNRPNIAARTRRGFTLVEMLVVVAVIALVMCLIAMLFFPARRGARQAAFKNSCRNNMKQLALALQNHADAYKTFPPLMFTEVSSEIGDIDAQTAATADRRYSYMVRLLPFMEEENLYQQIRTMSTKFTHPANDSEMLIANGYQKPCSPANIKINGLICPSFAGETENGGIAGSNYVAVAATTEGKLTPQGTFDPDDAKNTQAWNVEPDGMIVPDRRGFGLPMSRMKDGTSRTCVLVESREGTAANKANTPTSQNSWYKTSQSYVYAFPPSVHPGANDVGFDASGKFTPDAKTALNYGPSLDAPNRFYKATTSPGPAARNFGPGSDHMGGIVIHGMGDGSVQEIVDTVDPGAYYSVITVNGGEKIDPPWAN